MSSPSLFILIIAYFLHFGISLLRDALRFASFSQLRENLEVRIKDEKQREEHLRRLGLFFDDSGRNLREIEWVSYIVLITILLSSLDFFLFSQPERVEMVQVLWISALTGGIVFFTNFFVLRAFSEPFAETVLFYFYPLWRIIRALTMPFSIILHYLQVGVLRIAGRTEEEEEEEIEHKVLDSMENGEKAGVFENSEREMIENIIDFKDIDAGEVMTPRTEIKAASMTSSLDEVVSMMHEANFSRIPLYKDNKDQIIGYLHVRDLLPYWNKPTQTPVLEELMHSVIFIPESKKLRDLFQEFKRDQQHLAIVLDEYGGTAGLISSEDILEEIVGDIVDEHQQKEEQLFMQLSPDSVRVNARLRISELNEEFDLDIDEDEDYDSVGGWIISELGRIPGPGEQGELDDYQLRYRILTANERRIELLQLSKLKEAQVS